MDLISKINARQKKRELERKKKEQEEAVFKNPQKAYTPSSKRLLIIAAALAIAVIVYIAYTSEVVVKNSCGIMPGVECSDLVIKQDNISFYVHNFLKEDLNITLSLEGCQGSQSQYIRPNSKATYNFDCQSDEKIVQKKIAITYVGYSGLPHDTKGSLVGKLEP